MSDPFWLAHGLLKQQNREIEPLDSVKLSGLTFAVSLGPRSTPGVEYYFTELFEVVRGLSFSSLVMIAWFSLVVK